MWIYMKNVKRFRNWVDMENELAQVCDFEELRHQLEKI